MNKTNVLNKLHAAQEGDLFYENLDNGFVAEFTTFRAQEAERIRVKIFNDLDLLGETVVPTSELALAFVNEYEDEAIINYLVGCRLMGRKIESITLDPQRDCVYVLNLSDGGKAPFYTADLRMLAIKGEVTVSVWYGTAHNFTYTLDYTEYSTNA